MNDVVNLSLPSKPEYVSVARLTASFVANKMGFDIEAIEDIKLAVGEACNNAVLHSGSFDTYNLEFIQNDETLVIEIKDFGNGFKVENYTEPKLDDPQENGLGLFIIKSLMDSVTIESAEGNGTKIIMSKIVE
jgi:serine/threonine-protein kinase RsbW